MKIAILGLGVIGTTYAYAFQKAGHQVEHVLRDSKRNNAPKSLSVDLLDGRYHSKGENKHDTYEVHAAEADSEYDFIFLSVRHGFVKEAVETLRKNNIKGTLVFFCNFWDTRKEVQEWARGLRLYSGLSDSGRSHAGGPFGWCLVRPFNARR